MKLPTFLRRLFDKLRDDYPTVRLIEMDGYSAVFEVTNKTEDYRVSEFGGEREQIGNFLDLVSPDEIVWDIGSNVGVYSILAARKGAEIHAFEPDPGFAKHLRRNVDLNGQDVVIHEFALADETGTTTLYTDGVDGFSPSLADAEEERGSVTVDMKRAAEIAGSIPRPNVLKIDVEGAEASVLRGFEGQLSKVETIFIEVHPQMLPGFDSSMSEVRELIERHGHEVIFEERRDDQVHFIYQR